ncbi:double zinc ribbon domain-containing protein [Halobacteriales archaeon Cl-PHB]
MSKITFRADDDLVEQLEAMDASKSEVMREALRAHLDGEASEGDLEAVVHDRVDELVADRLGDLSDEPRTPAAPDVNVSISLEGATDAAREATAETAARPNPTERTGAAGADTDGAASEPASTCAQCGEPLEGEHVHCPNCGEKASRRVFCECGDELRSDWAFCPTCGRRTPAADVLEGP